MREVVCGLVMVCASGSAAWADVDLSGRWEGLYSCDAQLDSPMVLTIEPGTGQEVHGTLEVEIDGVPASSAVAGAAGESGYFALFPLGTGVNPLNGQVTPDGGEIEGTVDNCVSGGFRAARTDGASPDNPEDGGTPEPAMPLPGTLSAEADAWIASIRASIAELGEGSEETPEALRRLENDIILRAPWEVNVDIRNVLLAEFDVARAWLRAEDLLDELASGPDRLSEGGLGRVLWVVDQALASEWPEEVKERVREAALDRAAEVLRPELQAAAALAEGLPATLEGLERARAALAPIEDYRASMEEAFGTIDPEGLLEPLQDRLAALEADPVVILALRAALAEARRSPDPRLVTEGLLWRVLGPGPYSPAMATLVEEERERAALAAIDAEDRSPPGSDPLEPTLEDIVYFAHDRARFAASVVETKVEACQAGQFDDPLAAIECLPYATIGDFGGLDAHVTRVVKLGCEVEVPSQAYRCEFLQDFAITFAAGGPLAPDIVDQTIGQVLPGGYGGDVVQARFVREVRDGVAGWVGSWTIE